MPTSCIKTVRKVAGEPHRGNDIWPWPQKCGNQCSLLDCDALEGL